MNKAMRPIAAIFAMMLVWGSSSWATVVDGVETGPQPESATPNSMNFDPPCSFGSTLPLMAGSYMDPGSRAVYVDGEGAVLDECSNFGVSGYSPPNFLAFNCDARNIDGTKPTLPLEIRFSVRVSSVSVNVASGIHAGATATLQVYNAAHFLLGSQSVVLTPAVQTLSVQVNGIRYMRLSGPCTMIVDDLVY